MADHGVWFKLWCSAVDDPDLSNLDVADFGRWAKLGAITREHGQDGRLVIRPPAKGLCTALQVPEYETLKAVLHRLPNVQIESVSDETILIVTFRNWARYQADYSTPRVRRFRERETAKKRREEKRSNPPNPLSQGGIELGSRNGQPDAEVCWHECPPCETAHKGTLAYRPACPASPGIGTPPPGWSDT